MKKFIFTVKSYFIAAIAALGMTSLGAFSATVDVNVSGTSYQITTSSYSSYTTLGGPAYFNTTNMPWFGNASLAQSLAGQVRYSLGYFTPSGSGTLPSVLFAYGVSGSFVSIAYWGVLGPGGVRVVDCPTSCPNLNTDYFWAIGSGGLPLGPSVADTQQSLINTASVLQGTFTLQNSVMVNSFTYDCPVFDKHGVCVSAGGRNTTVQAEGINNTNALLITSYRLDANNSRIGAYADQNLTTQGPGTVQLGNNTPLLGLFGVWAQRPDSIGAEVKVSAAYGQKSTTITRQVVGTSEAGSGGSNLTSQGAQLVGKYGFGVMDNVIVSPYAGVRYTQNNMGGYTEASSSNVTIPLSYSPIDTNATSVLAGAEAKYRGIQKTTLFASAGVESDTNTSNGSLNVTNISAGALVPVNFNPNPVKTRPTASVGAYYDIEKNQRLGITGIYRQEPFQAVSTTTVMATYTVGI